jgi:2-polyprenyl-3-methyl-5-hydroxy-6-metoxy-1,4-benzoquinol methylase
MSWDEQAGTWDEDAAVRAYSEGAFSSLLRLAADGLLKLDGARILDFGCGTGLLTEKLSPRAESVVALDTSTAMIQVLNDKAAALGLANVETIAAPLQKAMSANPRLFGQKFDLVACSSVLAFLDDYPETVRELGQLLCPGGVFVQWDWELDPTSEEPFGLTRFQIDRALAAAGLTNRIVDVAFDVEFEGEHMRPLMGFGVRRHPDARAGLAT